MRSSDNCKWLHGSITCKWGQLAKFSVQSGQSLIPDHSILISAAQSVYQPAFFPTACYAAIFACFTACFCSELELPIPDTALNHLGCHDALPLETNVNLKTAFSGIKKALTNANSLSERDAIRNGSVVSCIIHSNLSATDPVRKKNRTEEHLMHTICLAIIQVKQSKVKFV